MNTGIILNHLSFADLTYRVVSEVNGFVKDNTDGLTLFVDNISNRMVEPHCAVMDTGQVSVINDGVIIATDLSGAQSLRKAWTPSKKVFFVWNLEWIYKSEDYHTLYDTINDPNLIIIARTDAHSKVIRNATNRSADHILEEFNLEKIHEICR
jgi:hypothetical protein